MPDTFDFWVGFWGIVTGIVSLVMGSVALALSVYFFCKAKESETATMSALQKLEGQVGILAKISGDQLRGLTRIVHEQVRRPAEPSRPLDDFVAVLTAVRAQPLSLPQEPSGAHGPNQIVDHGIPDLSSPISVEQFRDVFATMLLSAYFYSTHANLLAQMALPSEADYDETNETDRLTRQVLDVSASDFHFLAAMLNKWHSADPTVLDNHRLSRSFGEKGKAIAGLMKDARQTFEARASENTSPAAE